MMTKKALNALFGKILEDTDLNPQVSEFVTQVKGELEARDNILSSLGEPWDEEGDDFEFTAKNAPKPDGTDWQEKYNTLRKQYIDNFLHGKADDFSEPHVPDPQPQNKGINELFHGKDE